MTLLLDTLFNFYLAQYDQRILTSTAKTLTGDKELLICGDWWEIIHQFLPKVTNYLGMRLGNILHYLKTKVFFIEGK